MIFSGTQALQDAGLDYSSIEQAVVGYCYGENCVDSGYCKEKNRSFLPQMLRAREKPKAPFPKCKLKSEGVHCIFEICIL